MFTEQKLRDLSFLAAFQEFQKDAADINRDKGFSADDELINEFEQWFVNRIIDDDSSNTPAGIGSTLAFHRYRPLFQSFRNARIGLKLMLATGELGETLEAVRKNIDKDDHCPQFSAEEVEIADAMLRLMNYATDRNLRLAEAMIAKQEYNRTRHDHSKEARASEHGKRF
jgi:NTP pyrophosphatase (non-canonical NTP hydrolase)